VLVDSQWNQHAIVTGIVTTRSGEAAANVSVRVHDGKGMTAGQYQPTLTDATGRFSLRVLHDPAVKTPTDTATVFVVAVGLPPSYAESQFPSPPMDSIAVHLDFVRTNAEPIAKQVTVSIPVP
jgi:hypothetical protein